MEPKTVPPVLSRPSISNGQHLPANSAHDDEDDDDDDDEDMEAAASHGYYSYAKAPYSYTVSKYPAYSYSKPLSSVPDLAVAAGEKRH